MHKLLWIGSPFFAQSLSDCGWDLRLHNFEHVAVLDWQDVLALADGPPDVLVVADKSRPPFVTGMEKFPCLTVFYCVDSHIHSYYPCYAQGFDLCLVSLKDHIPFFQNQALPAGQIAHCPPFAKNWDLPPDPAAYAVLGAGAGSLAASSVPEFAAGERGAAFAGNGTASAGLVPEADALLLDWPKRDWDLLFVGTVDSENTPLRKKFMQALAAELPNFQVTRGQYRTLYPKARLLLNHCDLGDLNFRVFEALGCGGALLSPLVGHGFTEMFEPGKDLFVYEMNNPLDAARKVRELLADPALCLAAARSGFARVNRLHRARHRAEALTAYLYALAGDGADSAGPVQLYGENVPSESIRDSLGADSPPWQRIIQARLRRSREIHQKYLRLVYLLLAEQMEHPLLREAYLNAAR